MSDYITQANEVEFKRFDRDAPNELTGFRCYRSSPESATIQLRGVKQYATLAWIKPETLDELISNLQKVRAEFV